MLNPDFKDMLSALCDAKAEFLVIGAYALAMHGYPRATGDIDIWTGCERANAGRVWVALKNFGAPLSKVNMQDFATPDIVYQIGIAPNRIDILTTISGVEFEAAWASRIVSQIDGLNLPVISRADLIRNKRAAGRPKDLLDVMILESKE